MCAVLSVDSDVAVVTTCPQTSVPQQPSLSAPSVLCVPSTCAQGMTEEVEVEVAVRPWGFVELQRGEFDVIFGMLVSQAFSPEPLDLLESFRYDGWWPGLRWCDVAKALYVQGRMFEDDGWNIPRRVFKRLIEDAMRLHEQGHAVSRTSEDFLASLVPDPRKLESALQKARRFPCCVCGVVLTDVYRPQANAAVPRDRKQVYCQGCCESTEIANECSKGESALPSAIDSPARDWEDWLCVLDNNIQVREAIPCDRKPDGNIVANASPSDRKKPSSECLNRGAVCFSVSGDVSDVVNFELKVVGSAQEETSLTESNVHSNFVVSQVPEDELLGEGGFAQVWKKWDANRGHFVALKVNSEVAFAEYEAAIMQSLDHAHCLRLFDVLHSDEGVHLVFDFCDGGDLANQIDRGLYGSEAISLRAIDQILCGVHYLALQNIIHCDLKPANILVVRTECSPVGTLRIGDFGLAVRVGVNGVYEADRWAGTPAYMAPEQRLAYFNAQVDVWALGCIFYELLTGECLYVAMEDRAAFAVSGAFLDYVPCAILEQLDVSTRCVYFLRGLLHARLSARHTAATALRSRQRWHADEMLLPLPSEALRVSEIAAASFLSLLKQRTFFEDCVSPYKGVFFESELRTWCEKFALEVCGAGVEQQPAPSDACPTLETQWAPTRVHSSCSSISDSKTMNSVRLKGRRVSSDVVRPPSLQLAEMSPQSVSKVKLLGLGDSECSEVVASSANSICVRGLVDTSSCSAEGVEDNMFEDVIDVREKDADLVHVNGCRGPLNLECLEERLRRHAFAVRASLERSPSAGDGNCFYRSVAVQMSHGVDDHWALRQLVVREVLVQRLVYEPFFDEVETLDMWARKMRRLRCWGDHVAAQATANVLKRPLIIWHLASVQLPIVVIPWHVQSLASLSPVYLERSATVPGCEHYDALVLCNGVSASLGISSGLVPAVRLCSASEYASHSASSTLEPCPLQRSMLTKSQVAALHFAGVRSYKLSLVSWQAWREYAVSGRRRQGQSFILTNRTRKGASLVWLPRMARLLQECFFLCFLCAGICARGIAMQCDGSLSPFRLAGS